MKKNNAYLKQVIRKTNLDERFAAYAVNNAIKVVGKRSRKSMDSVLSQHPLQSEIEPPSISPKHRKAAKILLSEIAAHLK